MNKHQKKLRDFLEKKKVHEIINLIGHDQKGNLSSINQEKSFLLENIENDFEVRELFVDLCTFVFKKNHKDIYQKLISYRSFHKSFSFDSYCDFTASLISIENGELEMFLSIMENFNYKENGCNKSLIKILSLQCNRAIVLLNDKNHHLYKKLIDSIIRFIQETKGVFFEDTSEKTNMLIETLIKQEGELLEQQNQQKSRTLNKTKSKQYSILKPLYENNPSFLLRSEKFTENFNLFSIIIKSMIANTSADYVFNVYLLTLEEDGKTLFQKIKDEYPVEYIYFLEDTIFQNNKKNRIAYSFSENYTVFSFKIETLKNKEQHRLNINNIGHIMLKEHRDRLILLVDNNTIEIYNNFFSTDKERDKFKRELEKFINSSPEDEEIIYLKTSQT